MPADNQKNNPWFGISMVLAGVIGGFVIANVMNPAQFGAVAGNLLAGNKPAVGNEQPAPTPTAAPTPEPAGEVKPVDPDTDHIRGNPEANIAVIEYSDYECPFCKNVHATYGQVMDEYGDDVMWVFRHFPLSFHPNAQKAAEGSECAAELGGNDAFWAFTDMVFEKGSDNTQLSSYAEAIGLDKDEFQTCVDSGKYADKISTDIAEGTAAGVRGTPGNIVYNVKTKESRAVSGAQPFANFKAAIDELQ